MKQDHIIQKVFVEITVNSKEKAYRIKDDISSFLSMNVFQEIEKYLNSLEYKLAGRTLQIPRLELNLDVNNSELNAELKGKIAQLFKEELSEVSNTLEKSDQESEDYSKASLIGNQEKILQTFIFFLENGYMPWWNSEKKGVRFLEPNVFESLISDNNFSKSIVPVLSKKNVQERIINQLSDEQISQLCLAVLKNKELEINLEADVIHHISKLNYDNRTIIWRLVLNVISEYLAVSNNNLREYLLQQISKAPLAGLSKVKDNRKNWITLVEIFPFIEKKEILEIIENNKINNHENLIDSTEIIHQQNEEIREETSQNEGQYVQNAGLILIHPFIKTLFEYCNLLDLKTMQLTDPELCAHLLHYIATGNTKAPEYDMIFEKFLCNIPLNQTINRHLKLSRKHKTQAKNVIESVQYNWAPMKKSSTALLQNEFFQRPGKLVITDYEYNLTVERKTQDILLDKLGWGIGLVKLPWKEKFILVNW